MDAINAAFSPSAYEVEYYKRMVAAFNEGKAQGKAAVNFENKMVDIATVRRAIAALRRAG